MSEQVSAVFTNVFPTNSNPSPLNTGTFTGRPATQTPGNVAVCISGGGSRSFAAGIGQLQALEAVQANGASLLSQVRAILTISGGGWIGIPFTFLPASVSDTAFLGAYTSPGNLSYATIGDLPPQGIAQQITQSFSIASLALQAVLLYHDGVPTSILWQVLMGKTFLEPYGLYEYVEGSGEPATLFSDNSASLATYVTGPNPDLATETASLVAQVAGQQRPYLVSMSGMTVNVTGQSTKLLVPVQSTPFATGIFPTPPGASDANGWAVGGGAVSSFAFNSTPISTSGNLIEANQSRQWSLMDILGTSSAAFAQTLIEQIRDWAAHPAKFAAALAIHAPNAVKKLTHNPAQQALLLSTVDSTIKALRSPVAVLGATPGLYATVTELGSLQSIVPSYDYWSPVKPPLGENVAPTYFADGGSLENSGVASALSYEDIDTMIAFLNTSTALSLSWLHPEDVVLDDSVPPLFGYQPYDTLEGYQTYAGNSGYKYPVFQYNQVFSSSDFAALQQGLWSASQSGGPAVFAQTLTTVANPWFGVPSGKKVTVLWVYLNYSSAWFEALNKDLHLTVDWEYSVNSFPNYSTFSTELTATQINLLSNLTAWVIQESSSASAFTSLFTP
jgi:hypothetical protein